MSRLTRRAAAVLSASLAVTVLGACGSSSASKTSGSPSSSHAPSGWQAAGALSPGVADQKTFKADPALRKLLPASILSSGVLRTATRPDAQPYTVLAENGQVSGVEGDILTAVTQLLGLKLKTTPVEFAQYIVGVSSGQYDISYGNIADIEARESKVDFVNYFLQTNALVVPEDSSIKAPLDVCGKKTLLTTGTWDYTSKLNALCAAAGKPKASTYSLPTGAVGYLALESHRIDAYIDTYASISYTIDTKRLKLRAYRFPELGHGSLSFALKKGNTQLENAVVAALKVLIKDGYYDATFKRWGLSASVDHEPGINQGRTKSDYWAAVAS